MKITTVTAQVLRLPGVTAACDGTQDTCLIRIDTDEGITGVGEGSLQYKDAALTAELENFGSYLRGKDPFQIEHLSNPVKT